MFTIYTPCLVYTLSFFPANLEGQLRRRLNEAKIKGEIQELIGGAVAGIPIWNSSAASSEHSQNSTMKSKDFIVCF